jgi:thymidylate kinase
VDDQHSGVFFVINVPGEPTTLTHNGRQAPPAKIPALLATAFAELDRSRISYCLLRGHEELLGGEIDGDVDLLVATEQIERLQSTLERIGFVALSRWGQTPHHFFIGYDDASDRWLKLDVMTELAYGRPVPALRTDVAAHCLAKRVRHGPLFAPAPGDELIALLLHCILDKRAFEPKYRVRLAELLRQIDNDRAMVDLVGHCFPAGSAWPQIKELIARGEWQTLLELRPAVAAHLARRDPAGTRWRDTIVPMLRFLDRRTRSLRTRGLTVALLAPDGAGKTTLARSLGQAFYLPTRYIYMGTNTKSGAVTLPTTRLLAKLNTKRRPLLRALGALNSLLEQGVRYRLGAYHRRRGRLVVFDRYSAGSLAPVPQRGALHKRLQRWALRQLCPPPDMVVYLDAPAETLYQRKQEHSPELLERQRQRYQQILDGFTRTAVVDARHGPDEVRRQVVAAIWRRYAGDMQKK